MTRPASALLAPAPAERLASLRVLTGGFACAYLLFFSFEILAPLSFEGHRFRPVGVVSLLAAPLSRELVWLLYGVSLPLAAAFTTGFLYRFTAPAFALVLLFLSTYRNSWGMVFHTENLMVLHVAILAAAPSADAWSFDGASKVPSPAGDRRYAWAIATMSLVTVATYFVAGIAKLEISGMSWMSGDVLRAHVALDSLLKIELGSLHSFVGAWLVRFGPLFSPLALGTLALELGAPLALVGRRIGRVWVAFAWAFHAGVLVVMAIGFAYPLSGVAFASWLEPDVLWQRFQSRRHGSSN